MRIPFKTILVFSLIFISLIFLLLESSKVDVNTAAITFKNGVAYRGHSDSTFTGIITDTVNNQLLEYEVVNGIKNGKYTSYFSNGQIAVKGYLKNSMNIGEWVYFYPDGMIESKGKFHEDKVTGKWYWYFNSGSLKEEGFFKEGLREGKWISYSEDGRIVQTITFHRGEKINETEYYKIKSS